jgi:hypothetical protein
VGEDRAARGRVGETRGDRDPDDRHDLAGFVGERGEAEDAVAVGSDQSFVRKGSARLDGARGWVVKGHRGV